MNKVLKILHIIPDDGKFVKDSLGLFYSIPNISNEAWFVTKDGSRPKSKGLESVKGVTYLEFKSKCCDSRCHDVIIIHCLVSLPFRIIKDIHEDICLAVFTWGADIYDLSFPFYPLIPLKNTVRSYKVQYLIDKFFNIHFFNRLVGEFIRNKFMPKTKQKNAIKRIDYYSGVFPNEWEYIRKLNPEFRAKRFSFNYVNPLSPFTYDRIEESVIPNRNNIQVGHSGYMKLNHTNVFKQIKDIIPSKSKVIVPLSYAPSGEKYVNYVIDVGRNSMGEKFQPIKDFMEYKDYVKLMSTVNAAIFDIDRQCCVGNCLIAIWNGAKVFFPKKSLNYEYFKSIGVEVFTIEEDLNTQELSTHLSMDIIKSNRKAIVDVWSYENVRSGVIDSLRDIIANRTNRLQK